MTLVDHLPILVVVVPMLLAPLVAILPSAGRVPWLLATVTSLLTFLLAIGITSEVLAQGTLLY